MWIHIQKMNNSVYMKSPIFLFSVFDLGMHLKDTQSQTVFKIFWGIQSKNGNLAEVKKATAVNTVLNNYKVICANV